MGRAFEYRKATKLKRWGHMARTFTKLGKQIAVAVKAGGPEPENNPTLRAIIATCKRENMPKDNIERAIKNACGKDQSDYKTMTYEGYGPHGVAIFVDTLTDNATRTVGDVRSVFNKFNGNLGTMGSLAYLFDHKAVFTIRKKEGVDMDELILDLINLTRTVKKIALPYMVILNVSLRFKSISRKMVSKCLLQSLHIFQTM